MRDTHRDARVSGLEPTRWNTHLRRKAALVGAVALMAAGSLSAAGTATADTGGRTEASGGPGTMGTCPDKRKASIDGGHAEWKVFCKSGKVYVSGWVKDTKLDGDCVRVRAKFPESGDTDYSPWVCGWGEARSFDFSGGRGDLALVRLYTNA